MFYSPVTIIIFIIAIAFLARAAWSIHGKYDVSKDRLEQAKSQLAALKDQESDLSQSIARLSTASGTEEVIRTDFRVVKPGESLAVIIDNDDATETATATPETWWQGVGAWFGRMF